MQNQEEHEENDILTRAKRAMDENDPAYAKFLYKAALLINPQDNAARMELHRMRETVPSDDSIFSKVKFIFHALKMLFHRITLNHNGMIREAENLLDIDKMNSFALKSMLHAAYSAEYYKLVTLISKRIIEMGAEIDDLIIIAKSFLNEKIFDQAAKVAKEATTIDPENEEAKGILWQVSVEKHMNSDVQLVTAGGDKRFVPPKVDANKIFIASHKETKDSKKGDDGKGLPKP
jgi:tetratricopeptide (TPR) repeat protein